LQQNCLSAISVHQRTSRKQQHQYITKDTPYVRDIMGEDTKALLTTPDMSGFLVARGPEILKSGIVRPFRSDSDTTPNS
jgi:hypothetical protein